MARPFTNTAEHHDYIRLTQPSVYQQHGRATITRLVNVPTGSLLVDTAKVCLSSDWLLGSVDAHEDAAVQLWLD